MCRYRRAGIKGIIASGPGSREDRGNVNRLGMVNGHYRVGHGQGLSFSCKCFDVAACMMRIIRLEIAEVCVALMTFLFFFLLRLFLDEVSKLPQKDRGPSA